MWLGDRIWSRCSVCDHGWALARIVSVGDLYARNRIELSCGRRHHWSHTPSSVERNHLRPPQPSAVPPRYTVHRGDSEHGQWIFGAPVAGYEAGRRVIARWRREHPSVWCAIFEDGHPVMVARPARDCRPPPA